MTSSLSGVVDLKHLEDKRINLWEKISQEYAKGDNADSKKLEKWARQLTVIFHTTDASTQRVVQQQLAETLLDTNDELVKKHKNLFAQIFEGTSGALGVITVLYTAKIIFSAAVGNQSYRAVAGFIEMISKFGPMTTQGIDAITRASRAGDEAARLPVDHKMKSLTNKRDADQSQLHKAGNDLDAAHQGLRTMTSAEDNLWSAAARM